jgi:hypothetical protein
MPRSRANVLSLRTFKQLLTDVPVSLGLLTLSCKAFLPLLSLDPTADVSSPVLAPLETLLLQLRE